jgi:acyl-CoA reductase-like NAD-dependent aldehyde dehydrogenase
MSSAQNRRQSAIASVPDNRAEWPGTDDVAVIDPFTQQVVAHVARCGPAQVDEACTRAAGALKRGMSTVDRARVLDTLAELLTEHLEDIAALITLESGKSLKDSRGEVARGIETVRFSSAEARTMGSAVIPADATPGGVGKLALTIRVPVGVVAAISPFNFPLNTVLHKVAPAIAAGCPVVLKPAHQTPLTALRLRQLLLQAGLPEDWLTVVTDDRSTAGPALVDHAVPALITFTGSSAVGWAIAAAAPRKRVALELGSNSPVIVDAGTDPVAAASKIARGAFGTSGQACISVQRVIVHRSVHERLAAELVAAADRIVVGDPFDDATDIGPLIEPEAASRLGAWVSESLAAGGRTLAGGTVDGGCMRPTVVDQAPLGTQLRDNEAFGPVLTVIPFDTEEEAMALANETVYGLQAGIFTADIDFALRAARELDFGGVIVNDISTVRLDQQPYGGMGESGNTREGPAYAVREMTELKFVSFEPSSREREVHDE